MFSKSLKTLSLIAALATVTTFAIPQQEAQAAGGRNAAFAVGAITGLAVGAMATHASAHRHNGHYHSRYDGHSHGHSHGYARPAPWTGAWYDYCSARYRSFNPHTGYFVTYSGHRRFCR